MSPTGASRSDGPAARPSTISTCPIRWTSPASGGRGRWWPIGPSACWRPSSRTPSARRSITSIPSSSTCWRPGRPSARRGRASRSWRRSRPPIAAPGSATANPGVEDQRLEVQREAAEVALADAEEQLRADLRALGALLRMRPAEAERLDRRGSLHDSGPAARPGRCPAPPGPGLPPRSRGLPAGRRAGRGRRGPGPGESLSGPVLPLPALHVPE